MAEIVDIIKDVMIAKYRGQTPEGAMIQTMVADQVRSTKASAQEEVTVVEAAWEKKASSMHARGVTATDLEWVNAYKAYQEDLASARKWTGSFQAAGERLLEKVGR